MYAFNAKQPKGSIQFNTQNAPSKIKEAFEVAREQGLINLDKLDLTNLGFALQPTKSNFCSRPSSFGFGSCNVDKTIVCLDCTIQSENVRKAYANKKQQDERPVPFYVIKQQAQLNTRDFGRFCPDCYNEQLHKDHTIIQQQRSSVTCSCGEAEILKKQTFCSNHQSLEEIQCEINEQERKQFTETMGYLIETARSQNLHSLFDVIEDYLISLNTNSVYYNRLTFECINIDDLFYALLQMKYYKFYYYLMGDLRTRKNLIKLVCRLYTQIIPEKPEDDDIHNFKVNEAFNQIDIRDWLYELMNYQTVKKLCQEGYYHKVMHQFSMRKKIADIENILFETKLKQNGLKELSQINFDYTNQEQAELLLKKILNILESDEAFNKALSQTEQGTGNVPSEQLMVCKAVLKLVLLIKREDALNGLPVSQINKVLAILSRNFGCLQKIDTKFKFRLIPTFFKLAAHSGKVEYADLVWNSIAKINPVSKLVSHFYFVLSQIFGDLHRSQIKDKSPSDPEVLKNWFRARFIQPDKHFYIQSILNQMQCNYSKLQQIKQILNNNFYLIGERYQANNSGIRPNVIDEFSLNSERNNFRQMQKTTAHLGQKYEISENSDIKKMVDYALSSKVIVQIFDAAWKSTSEDPEFSQDKQKSGFLYLFALVLIDSLTRGSNAELRQRLEQIRDDDAALKKYARSPQEEQMIKSLLFVKQDQSKGNSLCWICNKQATDNSKFCYPASLNIKMTTTSAIFGPENCPTNARLTFCPHKVHANCFLGSLKNSFTVGVLQCRVCKKGANSILPASTDNLDQETRLLCKNSLIRTSVLGSKVIDIASDLIVYYKALVQSKGLKSFVEPFNRTEDQNLTLNTMESLLLQLVTGAFENSSEGERKEHLDQINNVICLIQKCPREDCRLVQNLFAKVLRSILLKDSWTDETNNLMAEIAKVVSFEEYQIVAEKLRSLSKTELKLPQSQKQPNETSNLIFEIPKFPETAKQCRQFYSEMKCSKCDQPGIRTVCLLRKDQICNQNDCQEKSFFKVNFDVDRGQIQDQTTNFSRQIPLYCNDLMVPFVKRNLLRQISDQFLKEQNYTLRKQGLNYVRSLLI